MSIVTMVLGESGTGKSASLRNLQPSETLLIQAVKKPMPFKSAAWKRFDKDSAKDGNIFQTDVAQQIISLMQRTKRKIIIIDDFQYVMANEFMRRVNETGFGKFTEIGRNAWDIMNAAAALPEDVRVYILSHIETSDSGHSKIKTIGKMLDEKIALEGMSLAACSGSSLRKWNIGVTHDHQTLWTWPRLRSQGRHPHYYRATRW